MKKICAYALVLACLLCGCAGNVPTEKEPQAGSSEYDRLEEGTESVADLTGADTESPVHLHPNLADCRIYGGYEGEQLMSVAYSRIALNDEESAEWPELADTLAEANRKREQTYRDSFDAGYAEQKGYINDGSFQTFYTEESRAVVARADSAVLAVQYTDYSYWGGAYGVESTSGETYDTVTGKLLTVADVCTDMDELQRLLLMRFTENSETQSALDEEAENQAVTAAQQYIEDCRAGNAEWCWLLGSECAVFFFNADMVLGHAAGSRTVYLPYAEYPALFQTRYTVTPENYILPLQKHGTNYADVTGDGLPEELVLELTQDEYGSCSEITISVNHTAHEMELYYCYDAEPFLVHMPGHAFLYLFCTGDNDFQFLQIFDLTGGEVAAVTREQNVQGSMPSFDYEYSYLDTEENIYYDSDWKGTFTDPENFELDSLLYILSTVRAHQNYSIDKSGFPKSATEYYEVRREEPFVTRVELEMELLDEGKEPTGEKVVLPVGTTLVYLRTDGESWADFATADGREVRALCEADVYPQKINGVDLEEALDGVLFAG